jgi:TRAP-type uncharacterized transport system substrate-binding protein
MTLDPDIKTMADLEGKKVMLGRWRISAPRFADRYAGLQGYHL